jgi:hypothetical protein
MTSAPPTAHEADELPPERSSRLRGSTLEQPAGPADHPAPDPTGAEPDARDEPAAEPTAAPNERAHPDTTSHPDTAAHPDTTSHPDTAAHPRATAERARRLRGYLPDALFALALLAVAGWLTHGLWPHPSGRALLLNPTDQALDEWFLAHATRLYAGDFRLVTDLLNAPDGINLLSNASLLLLGVLLAPVTLVFGAPVSFAVAVAGNLAATGFSWYLLFARGLRLHRGASAVAAAFTAFAPGMVSQANAHLHITAQWLVPPMVWCVLRLAAAADAPGPQAARTALRSGLLLGGLVSLQLFLGEEVLFLTALTLLLVSVGYALLAPAHAWRLLPTMGPGLAVAAGLALIVLGYPLWLQFAGPQHVPNGPFSASFFSTDLASFAALSPLSLAGDTDAARLSNGPAEYNTFLGLPLLLVAAGAVLWLWRRPAIVACALAAAVMAALSLGPHVVVGGARTATRGPYAWLRNMPVVDSALPTRFALALVPLLAVLLAYALHTALRQTQRLRLLMPVAILAALVPLAPRPLPTTDRTPVPRFISQGQWQTCVRPGGTLVPVPPPDPLEPDTMRWAAAAQARFALPEGFFIGPYASKGQASIGTYPRPTSRLLREVARSGRPARVTDDERAHARADVTYWRASCLVLAPRPNADALRATLDELFGPGEDVADVRIWRV